MMIFFIGVFNRKSTNWSQSRCLSKCGATVIEYSYRDVAAKNGERARDSDLVIRLLETSPDFVLISKGNTINVNVFQNVKSILWYMDPFNEQWNPELVTKMRLCDATVFALKRPFMASQGIAKQSFFVHEGFDPEIDKPHDIDFVRDVAFIGGMDAHRREYRVVQFDQLDAWAEAHAMEVSRTRINLNFVREKSGCSDRVYKVMAAGGFLLTERWPGMEKDFQEGVHLAAFSTTHELICGINVWLGDPTARAAIAEAGRQHVQRFSRIEWAKKIMEIGASL